MFRPSVLEESITQADLLFASFIAEYNLPFILVYHFIHLSKAMFPNSQIEKRFHCAATKTTSIGKGALNQYFLEAAISLCKKNPFSPICDRESDTDRHNFAIWARTWDDKLCKPVTRFLDMPVGNSGSAASLFELLDTALGSEEILWGNVVDFATQPT